MADKVNCPFKFHAAHYKKGVDCCAIFNDRDDENPPCSQISFICDENCQVFEYYKQLQEKISENKKLNDTLEKIKKVVHEKVDIYDGNRVWNKGSCVEKIVKIKKILGD